MKTWEKWVLGIFICSFFGLLLDISEVGKITSDHTVSGLFIIVVILYFTIKIIVNLVIKNNKKREEKKKELVYCLSEKIKAINELKNTFGFGNIRIMNHNITESEYSKKSYDRVNIKDIIFYHWDNNTQNFLTDVEVAYKNKVMYKEFINEINNLKVETSKDNIEKSKIKENEFNLLEEKMINEIINDSNFYNVTLALTILRVNTRGNISEKSEVYLTSEELFIWYEQWKNGKKYSTNAKIERKIMNNDIRYNVFKRDNFTCRICGASKSDGVKLHVDHIVPVSKGGKTVMNNLQTLCERCNMGKSNKVEEDFCPKCGSILVERKSKYGKFIGCSNYPKCHYKRSI